MKILLFCACVAATSLVGVASCVGQEEYELSFEGRWFDNVPRPGNAHFTRIIGATHNSSGSIFAIGETASFGIEGVAETGSTGSLTTEINNRISSGTAGSLVIGTDGFITAEETNTFNFFATEAHSQLSFLTMIAPSPDWFVGVHDLELRDSGGWRNEIVLNLNSYDAGTEDGSGLSLSNPGTNPRGVIAMLDEAEPSGALFGAGSLARVTISRVNPVLGDFDLDGDVDLEDLDRYNQQIGANAIGELEPLDLNDDGIVGADDFERHYSELVETSNGGKGTFVGDTNLDGTVNILGDAFPVISNIGNCNVTSWSHGDFNADGCVDVLGDGFLFVPNLGKSNGGGTSAPDAATIPEPGSIALFVLTGLTISIRRRRC